MLTVSLADSSSVTTVLLPDLELNKMESDSGVAIGNEPPSTSSLPTVQPLLLPNHEAANVAEADPIPITAAPPSYQMVAQAESTGTTTESPENATPGSSPRASTSSNTLCVEDLVMLADMFYLPFEYGPFGVQILEEVRWLKANAHVLHVEKKVQSPSPAHTASPPSIAVPIITTTHASNKSLADSLDAVMELAQVEGLVVQKASSETAMLNETPTLSKMDVVSYSNEVH